MPRSPDATRKRILESAAWTFARKGFREGTIREICSRARANVAAVSYHFGSKAALEEATLRWAFERGPEEKWMRPRAPDESPETYLRELLREFGRRFFGPVPEWRSRLVQRAMVETPQSMRTVLLHVFRPRQHVLQEALRPFLGGRDDREVALIALLITGQFLYFRVAEPVALDMLGETSITCETREWILDVAIEHTLRALTCADAGPAQEGDV